MLLLHLLNWFIKQLILLNKQINMKALPILVGLFSFRKSLFYFATLQIYCFVQWGDIVVAPFLISQCYNVSMGNPYYVRVSRFILSKKAALK